MYVVVQHIGTEKQILYFLNNTILIILNLFARWKLQ